MRIDVRQIARRKELQEFICLPGRVHRHHEKWVPPIYADEWRFFDPEKNRAFSYCDTVLALAYQNKTPVGRVMGIVNRRYNELRGEKTARFGFLECFEDKEVGFALLDFIEDWARQNGMNKLVGPMGFTDQDPLGFLVEGFEHEPTVATYYNFEYVIRFLESKGYEKEVDYVTYKVKVPDRIPEVYERILKRLSSQSEFTLLEFTRRKDIKPYATKVFNLMNETYRNLYGYVPIDEEEIAILVKRYLPVVDPRFFKVVARGGEVVAFVLGIPHLNEGLRKAKGRLFPLGILKIILAARRAKQLDLLLGAIKEDCRGRGLDALMGMAMIRSARDAAFEYMDSHHELETNLSIRAEMERAGGEVYKRFRIFRKQL